MHSDDILRTRWGRAWNSTAYAPTAASSRWKSALETADVVFVVSAIRDVTERRRLSQALAESEARYRPLIEDSPECPP